MSVIHDHGRMVETGKRLVGLSLGHSSYQHGLGSGGRGSRRCPLYWRLENTVVPFLPSDLSLAPLPDKLRPDDFHSSA